MDIEKIDQVIESILFVSGNAIEVKEITDKLELQPSEMKSAIKRLKEKFSGDSGIYLVHFNGKLQLASNPSYAEYITTILNPIREKELSRAALEVVAIIAYRQPITKLEIEHVRGYSSDYAVQLLLKHDLIEAVGRKDAIGKPLLFGTTDQFLKRFSLTSLDELPDYEELINKIEVVQVDDDAALYQEFEIPEEEIISMKKLDELSREDLPEHLQDEQNLQIISFDKDILTVPKQEEEPDLNELEQRLMGEK